MASSTKRRYGTYGRAITSPALLSSSVAWTRPSETTPGRFSMKTTSATPPPTSSGSAPRHEYATPNVTGFTARPPADPKQRSRVERLRQRISDRRTSAYMAPNQVFAESKESGDTSIQDLMNKYLKKKTPEKEMGRKSREVSSIKENHLKASDSRDSSPSIDALMKRYGSNGSSHRIRDSTLSRRESLEANGSVGSVDRNSSNKIPLNQSCREARLSGSDVKIKWEVNSEVRQPTLVKRFSVVIDPGRMPVGGSSSRTGRLARISQSNIRPFGGSNGGVGNASGLGGHPMCGAEPSSPTKKESKHRFEITKKLGSGTYGKVSLAYDHKFDREVAVKLIKKSAIENKADLVRIRREIRIMSALNHPNIIQIYEVFENKDKIILVMEYSSGGELYDYVSRCGSLPESEARRIFRQITSAVLYCHKHQVAHRDLKLENILLDQDNNAKIADFGLSNYFSDKVLLTTFCGSPLYASPEIINGTPYKGPEVDCWSLGILLYTLVYGSMPFDGRDFNRMVRQIKRGAYYEPETPSTASMLIRNMLRVNPDRRANIFDIASHWWLNLEENMPVIQELPENQITDHTPLTERAETLFVQDLADEQDVFMEFGHLSVETRRKIEDFRRRRKEAEEFNENSPVKPPKARKTDESGVVQPPQEEMKAAEKSLRGVNEEKIKVDSDDPLERLRQIENRLGHNHQKKEKAEAPAAKEKAPPTPVKKEETRTERKVSPEQPEDPKTARQQPVKSDSRAPSFVPVSEGESSTSSRRSSLRAPMSASAYRIETDSLNMLMNQVLEQMEKGPVNLNMIARIKAHPLYDTRPMVKELLESIIAAQPDSVQKQTSKVLQQQQSQTFSRTSTLTRKSTASVAPPEPEEIIPEPPKSARNIKKAMNERPWHSVEVGFDPDDDVETEGMNTSIASNTTEVTVQDTSFEDSEDEREAHQKTPVPTTPVTPKVVLGPLVGDNSDQTTQTEVVEEEDTDEEEYTDSEMEDLADEVELVEKKVPEKAAPPQIATSLEPNPPPDPSSSPQFLDAFDRGLIKRQSKGKYQFQHTLVNMYGRGVSTECESPTTTRKFFGGPQPAPELSPFLFDKAKEMIMQYPSNKLDKRAIEMEQLRRKKKLEKVKADLLAQPKEGEKPRNIYVGSVPPRTPPPISVKSDGEQSEEEEEDEEEDEESEEESDAEIENVRPRGAIISSVRRDDGETIKPGTSAKYLVTVAELRMKPTSGTNSGATTEPKPYHRPVSKQNGSDTPTEAQAKEEPRSVDLALSERRTSETNPLFRPNAYMASDLYRRINSALERPSVEHTYEDRAFSPIDPFYAHHTGAAHGSSLLGYVRPRYHDDSYRVHDRPSSPTKYSAAVSREERGKSTSYDPFEHRNPYDRTYIPAPNASPSYGRKFDHDSNNWASEPRRFEVYKTRAERDAERNTLHTTPTAATSYRPSSYYSDRPVTLGYRRTDDVMRPGVESYSTYRRFDNDNRATTPGNDHYGISAVTTEQPSGGASRFRPSTRRVVSALNEADRRAYNRSRSMDRNKVDLDFSVNRSRLMTPDAPDYSYVNYHDSSNGRSSVSFDERGQPRGILKNKQSSDLDPRESSTGAVGSSSAGPVRSVIDRLKRHLSFEKSVSPQRQLGGSLTTTNRAPSIGASSRETPSASADKKKRSLLSFNRRKTSEVRLGADGKLITNGYDDSQYTKRPSSPIERIKSLFRKSDAPSSHADYYSANRTSAYPSSATAASSSPREPYVAQYRKYPGSSSRDPSTALNRYSYTPGLTDQRRHWYDDPNIY